MKPNKGPVPTIEAGGVTYKLIKNAAVDTHQAFPHERVTWLQTGCEKATETLYYCWLRGVLTALPNSLEKPLDLFYVGFSTEPRSMHLSTITLDQVRNIHIYAAESISLAQAFGKGFLDLPKEDKSNETDISATPK